MKIRRFNESKGLDLKDEFQGIIDLVYDDNVEFNENRVLIYLDEFRIMEEIITNKNFKTNIKEIIEQKELEVEFYNHLNIILNRLSDYGYFFEFKQNDDLILEIEFKKELKDNIDIEDFLIPNIGDVFSTFSGDHLDITSYSFNKLKFIKYFNQEYNVTNLTIVKDKKSEYVMKFSIPEGSMTSDELYEFLNRLNKFVIIKDGKEYKKQHYRFDLKIILSNYIELRFDHPVYIV